MINLQRTKLSKKTERVIKLLKYMSSELNMLSLLRKLKVVTVLRQGIENIYKLSLQYTHTLNTNTLNVKYLISLTKI